MPFLHLESVDDEFLVIFSTSNTVTHNLQVKTLDGLFSKVFLGGCIHVTCGNYLVVQVLVYTSLHSINM